MSTPHVLPGAAHQHRPPRASMGHQLREQPQMGLGSRSGRTRRRIASAALPVSR